MEDVRKLDEQREKARNTEISRQGTSSRSVSRSGQAAAVKNRFHNFEQRDTDYDALVLKQLKEKLGQQ